MRFRRHHFEHKESIITFLCANEYFSVAQKAVLRIRNDIEGYILQHSEFATTHKPINAAADSPEIVKQMCLACERVNVGPMASVAGAVAHSALIDILNAGASEAVVDNGGDIALFITEPIHVGIFPGYRSTRNLAFRVLPLETPIGICTSSGTVGPSFSYGNTDAAIVISEDVLLADAAATALGNQVKSDSDIENAFQILDDVHDIEGAMIILGDKIGTWGTLPQLIKTHVDTQLITHGR